MKKELFYSISDDFFARFPDYVRGVVIARGVTNGASPPQVREMLRSAEASVRERISLEELTTHPSIASWRDAFRKAGIKTSEYRPSIEAMVRRVLRSQELPSINTLVDIGNILSLRHLVPTGGHALDEVKEDIALRLATGEELFTPFGTDQVERPDPGEIIFAEGNAVLTRRWCWRQANHTSTQPETTAIEFNVDGLHPVTRDDVEKICHEVMEMTTQFCGGTARFELLTRQNARISL